MPTLYTAHTPLYTATGGQGSTRLVAAWGRTQNKSLPPVIECGGWPGTGAWNPAIGVWSRKALTAAGYTVITVWTGANWGHPTGSSAPSSGPTGTGTTAISDARTWAGSILGLQNSVVHIYGTSMGGTNAAAWAAANPSLVGGVYMMSPALSLLHIWDLSGTAIPGGGTYPNYASSMASAYGTTPGDRAAFSTASQSIDPVRNTASFSGIGSHISIFAARDDDVIGWSNCASFASATGATLTASAPEGEPGGGHITPNLQAAYNEFDALQLFDSFNP
ncbi:MAG: Alpha/beta hydrolase [Patescibacteria group bacterium]|nr:Alpha/beta hydrolase [Patescibacteria group bacterium]